MNYDRLIIGLTGNALDDDVLKFITAGADDVLMKPLRLEHLQEILKYTEVHGFDTITAKRSPFSFSRKLSSPFPYHTTSLMVK